MGSFFGIVVGYFVFDLDGYLVIIVGIGGGGIFFLFIDGLSFYLG